MQWTDRQVELLIRLWNEGKSPSQIAARLNAVGRDTVLDKIELLKLGRPSRLRSSLRHARVLQACRISAGQHSPRFRTALAGQAQRRAAGDDGFTVPEGKPAWTGDRHARLFASLLALGEEEAEDDAPSQAVKLICPTVQNAASSDQPRT
jgi:hypothetical protein